MQNSAANSKLTRQLMGRLKLEEAACPEWRHSWVETLIQLFKLPLKKPPPPRDSPFFALFQPPNWIFMRPLWAARLHGAKDYSFQEKKHPYTYLRTTVLIWVYIPYCKLNWPFLVEIPWCPLHSFGWILRFFLEFDILSSIFHHRFFRSQANWSCWVGWVPNFRLHNDEKSWRNIKFLIRTLWTLGTTLGNVQGVQNCSLVLGKSSFSLILRNWSFSWMSPLMKVGGKKLKGSLLTLWKWMVTLAAEMKEELEMLANFGLCSIFVFANIAFSWR